MNEVTKPDDPINFTVETEREALFITHFLTEHRYMFMVDSDVVGMWNIYVRRDQMKEVLQKLADAPGVHKVTVESVQ